MSSIVRQPALWIAGIASAALLAGWAAGVGAQSTDNAAPAAQPVAVPGQQAPAQQAPAQQANATLPPLPLGHDDVREVQNQLIALGFDPGAADGQPGPATMAAAQQYDRSRGGTGQVSIDGALLARLKADTAMNRTPPPTGWRRCCRCAPSSRFSSNRSRGQVRSSRGQVRSSPGRGRRHSRRRSCCCC